MISVDDKIGSREMLPRLKALGVECELTRMSFGDLSFYGQVNRYPISCGIEIKNWPDVLACIVGGRYAGHQLPGLIKSYDHVWLLVNGEYRCGRGGILELRVAGRGGGMYWQEAGENGGRRWMWRDVMGWINSVTILGGTRVSYCANWDEGAMWIRALYGWFQRESHSSTQVVYSGKKLFVDKALMTKPTLAQRVAKELPRIGVERSADVAKHFGSVSEMVNASEREWMAIPGVGKTIAKTIVKAIHGSNGKGH